MYMRAGWRKSIKAVVVLACVLLFTACSSIGSVNTDIGEEKVRLNAGNVKISDGQYRQIEDICQELRHVILDRADAGKWSDLCALLPQEDFRNAGDCYISSKPLIEWDYDNNDIYQIKLLAFSKNTPGLYFIMLELDNGKPDYKHGGYEGDFESITEEIEILHKFPDKKFIGLRPDYYNSCLMSEDKYIYPGNHLILSGDEFFGQFDFGRMGFRYQEAVSADNCREVTLDDLQ